MTFYRLYTDWYNLEKTEISLLCALAQFGGEYEGSISKLYKTSRLKKIKDVGTEKVKEINKIFSSLQEREFIIYRQISKRIVHLSIIERGKQYRMHEDFYWRIKKKHENGVGWENVMKLLLYLNTQDIVYTTYLELKECTNASSKQVMSDSLKVLEKIECVSVRERRKFIGILTNGNPYIQYYYFIRFFTPHKYMIIENEEDQKKYDNPFYIENPIKTKHILL